MRYAHAFAATAGRCLDHDRVADRVRDLERVDRVRDHAEMAGNGRNLCLGSCLLALDLVAHGRDGAGIGTDEDNAGLGQRAGKGFLLGQKAIAGMHGLGRGLPACVDDLPDRQIALSRRRRTDGDGHVRHFHVECVPIGVGIDGDGLDTQATRGLDDPAGDLAAIGDQNPLEHALDRSRKPLSRLCGAGE